GPMSPRSWCSIRGPSMDCGSVRGSCMPCCADGYRRSWAMRERWGCYRALRCCRGAVCLAAACSLSLLRPRSNVARTPRGSMVHDTLVGHLQADDPVGLTKQLVRQAQRSERWRVGWPVQMEHDIVVEVVMDLGRSRLHRLFRIDHRWQELHVHRDH